MPVPFVLAALFGKAAASAAAKGLAGKASANGAKGIFGHHAHHKLAQRVAEKVAEKAADSGVHAAFQRSASRTMITEQHPSPPLHLPILSIQHSRPNSRFSAVL